MFIKYSNMEPHQEIKWAGNGYISNVRLEVKMTCSISRGCFPMFIKYSNKMKPRQEIKWAGNGYINNVRLGVRITWSITRGHFPMLIWSHVKKSNRLGMGAKVT